MLRLKSKLFFRLCLLFLGLSLGTLNAQALNTTTNDASLKIKASNALTAHDKSAQAGFQIYPMNLSLTPAQPIQSINLVNHTKEMLYYQLTDAATWQQVDSKDVYKKSTDVIVMPPIIRVEPGHTQLLRVGYIGKWDFNAEKAYRINLHQVLEKKNELQAKYANEGPSGMLNVLFDISFPVFVEPTTPVKAKLSGSAIRKGDHFDLSIKNSGGKHLKLLNLSFLNADGIKLYTAPTPQYVLAHRDITFSKNVAFPHKTAPKEIVLSFDDNTELRLPIQ